MKLSPLLRLWRPPLLLLGFLASAAILKWSSNLVFPKAILILCAIGFGNAALNVLNELVDLETDRINKPWKPLPSGEVSVRSAWISIVVFAIISLASLLLLLFEDPSYTFLGLLGLSTALSYNLGRKDLLGNVFLGTAYASAALMSAYPRRLQMTFAAPFALFTVAFNIVVQWQDLKADKASGLVTVPIQLGERCLYLSAFLVLSSLLGFAALYVRTGAPFLWLFVLADVLVISGIYFHENSVAIEWLLRRGARLALILGFLWMLLG